MRKTDGTDRPDDAMPVEQARMLFCLLASYEIYGASHVWPACLDRPSGEAAGR